MRRIVYLAVIVLSSVPGLVRADDGMAAATPSATSGTAVSTGTSISAGRSLPGGRYYGTIAPSFNASMAGQLEKAFALIPGVSKVVAHTDDSMIHFTISDLAHVQVSDIQKMVAKALPGAVISTPILEHSLAANPGI